MRDRREMSIEREYKEREYRERECAGRCGVESETRGSQTRESRCIDSTNAGFETRV